MPLRGCTACQGDEMGFGAAVELGGRSGLPGSGGEGGDCAHLQEPPAHASDRRQAHVQRLGDAFVRPTGATGRFIRLQQNARVGLCPSRRLAGAYHLLEGRAFLVRQCHPNLHAGCVRRGIRWEDSNQFHACTLQKIPLPVIWPVTEH
jgi:hypothetical protein